MRGSASLFKLNIFCMWDTFPTSLMWSYRETAQRSGCDAFAVGCAIWPINTLELN